MREKPRDPERLEHILDACNKLLEIKTQYTYEQFIDPKQCIIFYGFAKLIEIIGEAIYMLSNDFKRTHPQIDWLSIERMRHVLVHGYYSWKPQVIWETIQTDVPALLPIIEKLLREIESDE